MAALYTLTFQSDPGARAIRPGPYLLSVYFKAIAWIARTM